MGTLYIVATPIGNLEDITLRALRILKEVDLILCEDTRVTKALLERYTIQAQTESYHQHSKLQKVEQIKEQLSQGKNIALVSDAGTPGISDPGNQLVQHVSEQLPEVSVVPIPGVSALTALASVSGFAMDKFLFLGFPPQKNKRKKFFEEVAACDHPVVLYESPYRLQKTLQELQQIKAGLPIVVGREITKKFETIYRGTVSTVAKEFQKTKPKGEFVLIVGKTRA